MDNITFLKNEEINRAKWDQCIENSCNGTIYAMSWYLDVSADYWDALISGDYEIVFPITYTKKFGFKILRQPVSSQQLGLFSKEVIPEETIIKFLEAIPGKFLFGDLHLNAGNKIESSKRFPVKYRVNIELDVRDSIEEIRGRYVHHRNLKKASKNNITIKNGENYIRIINIFRNNRGTSKYHIQENTFKRIYEVFGELNKRNLLKVYDAYDKDGNFIAGDISTVYKNRHIASFSGCTEKGYKLMSGYLLLDYSIAEASKEVEVFDFEGSNTESLAFIYHGFGGKTVPYPVVTISHVPRLLVKSIILLRRVLRKS